MEGDEFVIISTSVVHDELARVVTWSEAIVGTSGSRCNGEWRRGTQRFVVKGGLIVRRRTARRSRASYGVIIIVCFGHREAGVSLDDGYERAVERSGHGDQTPSRGANR